MESGGRRRREPFDLLALRDQRDVVLGDAGPLQRADLDLYPAFKAHPGGVKSYDWPVDIHWTPQGNAAVADLVEAEIKSRFPGTLAGP